MKEIAVFWFRRDLRLDDNIGLYHALKSGYPVLPIFIFDEDILNELPKDDARVSFIYKSLQRLNSTLRQYGSSLKIEKGFTVDVWKKLLQNFQIKGVYVNKDYEPYAIQRDLQIKNLCKESGVNFYSFKDQVIFEENDIVKSNGLPYTVFTPYKNKWLEKYKKKVLKFFPSEKFLHNFHQENHNFPRIDSLGFQLSPQKVLPFHKLCIPNYDKTRDIPAVETSNAAVYVRFGTLSIRKLVAFAIKTNLTYTSELIWREFFMQILFHFPKVVHQNFKEKYNGIKWRNNEEEFKLWCEGKTGYPIVDAGMQQLNQTGTMHNRVRMITASFLTKHLLIDWRWGEAYFAKKLLDYELASNNGNWQWVAGTGCDAAPYFRVFNPLSQQQKFDPNFEYITKWNPNYKNIPKIVNHQMARERYLIVLKNALSLHSN